MHALIIFKYLSETRPFMISCISFDLKSIISIPQNHSRHATIELNQMAASVLLIHEGPHS